MVSDAVAADFVPVSNQFFQHFNVIFAPINFPPIIDVTRPTVVVRVLIGNQEKCSLHAVAIEDGDGLFKLTPKSVIES